jgi:hypothetical protein
MLFIRSVFYCPAGIDGLEQLGFGEAIQLHADSVGGFAEFGC